MLRTSEGRLPALLAFIDYHAADCGPYRELLLAQRLGGRGAGLHLTVTRILVSTTASLVNGRRNWGMPKELARFEVEEADVGRAREACVTSTRDGGPCARLHMRAASVRLPMTTALVPRAWRTFTQHLEGREYRFAPSARGWLAPARVLSWRVDESWPALAGARALGAVRVVGFTLIVPAATIHPLRKEPGGESASSTAG